MIEPLFKPQVVFVDPMFPDTGNKAAAKKDMQAFQEVIGGDDDSPRLLAAALSAAREAAIPLLQERFAASDPTNDAAKRARENRD